MIKLKSSKACTLSLNGDTDSTVRCTALAFRPLRYVILLIRVGFRGRHRHRAMGVSARRGEQDVIEQRGANKPID